MNETQKTYLKSALFGTAAGVIILGSGEAYSQSTAAQSIPGYLTTSGCPGATSPCFIPYGAAGNVTALPVNVVAGNLSTGNVTIGNVSLGAGNATIGALLGNQSVNLQQVSGTTTSVNNGTTDAGTQRVSISSDSTGQVKIAPGTSTIGNITNIVTLGNITGTPGFTCVSGCAGNVTVGNISLAAGNATIGALIGNQSVNEQQIAGTTVSANNGATDAGTQRVTLSTDGTGQVKLAAGVATIGNVTTVGSITGNVTLGASTNVIGHVINDAGTATLGNITTVSTVTAVTAITNALPAGTNTLGNLTNIVTLGNITGTPTVINGSGSLSNNLGIVVLSGSTTQGSSIYSNGNGSTAGNNTTNIKNGAGTLYSPTALNTSGNLTYIRFYNSTTAPNCSSATNLLIGPLPVPASTTGAGWTINLPSQGVAFSSGISYCLTGGATTVDNTAASTGTFLLVPYQ